MLTSAQVTQQSNEFRISDDVAHKLTDDLVVAVPNGNTEHGSDVEV